ncbi:MAG: hypothetical protein DRJ31_00460 [Candidatus Methanomethylicota archaeon]|uniref:Uncharacterized protein n=1 Tax=Thermoproteota archaeon TaxID=2056631 RepID=A0A497EU26_9CREN|nr:MAG: hypothetical protein DRJ31_00460 [Candidatus Verstraetearchaeota archaeon]
MSKSLKIDGKHSDAKKPKTTPSIVACQISVTFKKRRKADKKKPPKVHIRITSYLLEKSCKRAPTIENVAAEKYAVIAVRLTMLGKIMPVLEKADIVFRSTKPQEKVLIT